MAHKKQTVTKRRCPQHNRCVFSNWWKSRKVCSESRRWRGRLFDRRGPATVNERSPSLLPVLGTSHVATLDDRSRRRPIAVVSWQSSTKYCGDRSFIALYNKTASLNSCASHWQPTKLPQDERDVLTTSCTSNKDMLQVTSSICSNSVRLQVYILISSPINRLFSEPPADYLGRQR